MGHRRRTASDDEGTVPRTTVRSITRNLVATVEDNRTRGLDDGDHLKLLLLLLLQLPQVPTSCCTSPCFMLA